MKKHVLILFSMIWMLCYSQANAQTYTDIPDPNFEKALIDLDIDTDGIINAQVLTSDIDTITRLDLIKLSIDSLNGIEDFIALKSLDCSYNNLTKLDVSNNTDLEMLNFSSNRITTIDISSNTKLNSLYCYSNQLTNLNVGNNPSLKILNFGQNRLTNIDISGNDSIYKLNCASNQITAINVSNLDTLVSLDCSSNKIAALDISSNDFLQDIVCGDNLLTTLNVTNKDSLKVLDCSKNQLSSIDVTSNLFLSNLICSDNQIATLNVLLNDSLSYLSCANNILTSIDLTGNSKLTSFIASANLFATVNLTTNSLLTNIDLSYNSLTLLDVSNNTNLTSLNCQNNQLSYLNIQNGNNGILETFYATSNPELYCILVDDKTEADANTSWLKDALASYSDVPCVPMTYVPDDNFEQALIDLGYDVGPLDDFIYKAAAESAIVLRIPEKAIEDLTGIQDFVNLDTLDLSKNDLYNLDISTLTNLRYLVADTNNLIDLTIDNTVGILDTMNIYGNPDLTCIQVTDSTAAEAETKWVKDATAGFFPLCISNKTFIADANFERELIRLGYDNGSVDHYVVTDSINKIKSLDLSALNISDLTGIQDFTKLDTLDCSENRLSSLSLAGIDSLIYLSCHSNQLSTLDISVDTLLTTLLCGDNYLSSLDVSTNIELERLECNGNLLTALDVSLNTKLKTLNVNSNNLTSAAFNVNANTVLLGLFCSNNVFTNLDLTNNTLLTTLDFSKNSISTIDLSANADLTSLDCSINLLTSLDLSNNPLLLDVKANSNQIPSLNLTSNPDLLFLYAESNKLTSLNISSNDTLLELSVSTNSLDEIDLSANTYLRELYCGNNLLEELDVSANDSLRLISCDNNFIPDLDVNSNLYLEELFCNGNLLDSLIVLNNDSLFVLSCKNNNLDSINLSTNLLLEELLIDDNKLYILDVGLNTELEKISASNNELVELDITSNTKLEYLFLATNKLESVKAANGNNAILETFYTKENPDLLCIEIDDVNNIGDKWEKDDVASYSENCYYNLTYVPDDNFEAALSTIIGEASNNNDDYIPTSDIEILTSLDVSGQSIADLTGIQDFEALVSLNINNNLIDSVDLSQNLNLKSLMCVSNSLDSLGLNQNTALETLIFSNNQLTKIDLSLNTALKTLIFEDNQLSEIDVSLNTNLQSFSSLRNPISTLDFTSNTSLITLICASNELVELDLTANPNLTLVMVHANKLERLFLKNGNNSILTIMDAQVNPLLGCIEVDDPAEANAGNGVYAGWNVDAGMSYSDICHYGETYVPDDAFEQALKDKGYDGSSSDPLDDYVPTAKIEIITSLNLRDKGIVDMTGIEDFASLTALNCSDNQIESIDLSINTGLQTLLCASNSLTTIDLTANVNLYRLDLSANQLSTLDVSTLIDLTELKFRENDIMAINITNNGMITYLDGAFNNLVSVDANNGNNAAIAYLDLRTNPDLTCILVDNPTAASGYTTWRKDIIATYRTVCDDDDNDGVLDVDDLCINTPYGDEVDLFGCTIFTLAADNFTISTTSESCRSSNNGKVNIVADAIHPYVANLVGFDTDVTYNFTNTVEIRNIRAGTYELCITVEDQPTYSNCYELIITQPEDLYVESQTSKMGNVVSYVMSGGNEYTIDFNGFVFTTTKSQLSLTLEKGENRITIRAENDCQGIFEESIFVADESIVYPNPFNEFVTIYLNQDCGTEVQVEVYSYTGQLVHEEHKSPQNGLIRLDLPQLPKGPYLVLIKSANCKTTMKIIKE